MVYPDTDGIQLPNTAITHYNPPVIPEGKKITMTLIWGDVDKNYQIKSITNTTTLKPKMWLSESVVAKLNLLPNWEIAVIEDQFLQNILGMIAKIPVPVL